MKSLNKILISSALLLSLAAQARGPGTDGGGNGLVSSPQEVAAAVATLREKVLFGLVSEAETRQILNPKYVEDADVKKVLESLRGGPEGKHSGVQLIEELMKTPFQAVPGCQAHGKAQDACTGHFRGSPIKMSTKRLSRYAKDQLELELAHLALHELVHHFGFGEREAYKFQNYMREFVRNFFQLRDASVYLPGAKYLEMRPGGLVDVNTRGGKAQVRCLKEGTRWVDNKLDEEIDVTIILGGQSIIKNSSAGKLAVSCRKYRRWIAQTTLTWIHARKKPRSPSFSAQASAKRTRSGKRKQLNPKTRALPSKLKTKRPRKKSVAFLFL